MSKEIGPITTNTSMSAERNFTGFTPMKAEGTFFSADTRGPRSDSRAEAILYQRPHNEHSEIASSPKTDISEIKNRITISESDGSVPEKKYEYLYKRPEVSATEGKLDNEKIVDAEIVDKPETEHSEVQSHQPENAEQVRHSTWVAKQSHLSETREVADRDTKLHESEEAKTDDKPATKLNPFVNKFQSRIAAVQTAQASQAVTPERVVALETKVAKKTENQPRVETVDDQTITEDIEQKAVPEVGKIVLDPKKEVRVTTLTVEQAQLEISTKLEDGAKVARNMIKILEDQDVEPQLARETAVEKVTQTLVKTLKEKQLDQFIRNDEEQPEVHADSVQVQPKIEVKEYIDAAGHQITEKITTDEFDIVTIEREEIIAERDPNADANRVEMASLIGEQLFDRAREGGSSYLHTKEVSELMPEEPGEALASHIRTQLNLMLDTEEQYDFFKDVLGKVGYVNNEFEVTRAAQYATDIAPAVRLTRNVTTERVLPSDEERAINRGQNYSLN